MEAPTASEMRRSSRQLGLRRACDQLFRLLSTIFCLIKASKAELDKSRIMAPPPSKPHVEGDGFSQPHVLHWESPGTRGINGYSVQVKVDGPAGDGKFHSLLADTKSKSTKASLSSLALSAGHSYTFRVAAHISGGGWGPSSEPSEPIQGGGGGGGSKPSSPQARRRGVPKDGGGGGGASSSAAPESAATSKRNSPLGRAPSNPRPFRVRQRPARVGRLRGARQEVQGREARRPRRRRPRKRRRRPGRHDTAPRARPRPQPRPAARPRQRRRWRRRELAAPPPESEEVRAAREEEARLARLLSQWDAEFYRRQNRRPRPEGHPSGSMRRPSETPRREE